jgi:hypothetical protein
MCKSTLTVFQEFKKEMERSVFCIFHEYHGLLSLCTFILKHKETINYSAFITSCNSRRTLGHVSQEGVIAVTCISCVVVL